MPEPIEFPELGVRLSRDEWMAVLLKLAGRGLSARHQEAVDRVEAKMLQQLKGIEDGN